MIAGSYSQLMSHSEHESKKISFKYIQLKTQTSYFDVVKIFEKWDSVLEHSLFTHENRSAWGVLVHIASLFVSTKEVHSKKTFWLAVKYFKYVKKQILKQLNISVFFHFQVIQLKTIYLQLFFLESTESECFLEILIFSYSLTLMFHADFVILLS